MEDISKGLKEAIDSAFNKGIKTDKTLSAIVEKSANGDASYEDAYTYADHLGGKLAEVFKTNLSSDILPDGKMYYNIAQKVVVPPLEDNYKMAAELAARVQQILNKEAGIGIKAIRPKLDKDRIDGIVNRLSGEAHYDDVSWILDEPVKLLALSAVDDCIKTNAEFQGKAGLTPKIVRRAERRCCKWCSSLTGEYEYPDVPKDVYRRHENCRCTVDYIPDGIKKQNVWSKKWNSAESDEKIEYRKSIALETYKSIGKDVKKLYYNDATPKKGSIFFETDYNAKSHSSEIKVAEILHNNFGGDITLLQETSHIYKGKRADYFWHEAFWELKSPTTAKAIDSAVRSAIHQISPNPGGVILDFTNHDISMDSILKAIDKRMLRNKNVAADIIIIQNERIIKILRY